jgi:hypothetical protein
MIFFSGHMFEAVYDIFLVDRCLRLYMIFFKRTDV